MWKEHVDEKIVFQYITYPSSIQVPKTGNASSTKNHLRSLFIWQESNDLLNTLNHFNFLHHLVSDIGAGEYFWMTFKWDYHCVKSVQIGSLFWSVFSCIRTEFGDLRSKSPCSVRIKEIRTRKNSICMK